MNDLHLDLTTLTEDALTICDWGFSAYNGDEKSIKKVVHLKDLNEVLITEKGEKITKIESTLFQIHPSLLDKLTILRDYLGLKKYIAHNLTALISTVLNDTYLVLVKQFLLTKDKIQENTDNYLKLREMHLLLSTHLNNTINTFYSFLEKTNLEDTSVESTHFISNKDIINYNQFGEEVIHVQNIDYKSSIIKSTLEITAFSTFYSKHLEDSFSFMDKNAPELDKFKLISEQELWADKNKHTKYIL